MAKKYSALRSIGRTIKNVTFAGVIGVGSYLIHDKINEEMQKPKNQQKIEQAYKDNEISINKLVDAYHLTKDAIKGIADNISEYASESNEKQEQPYQSKKTQTNSVYRKEDLDEIIKNEKLGSFTKYFKIADNKVIMPDKAGVVKINGNFKQYNKIKTTEYHIQKGNSKRFQIECARAIRECYDKMYDGVNINKEKQTITYFRK